MDRVDGVAGRNQRGALSENTAGLAVTSTPMRSGARLFNPTEGARSGQEARPAADRTSSQHQLDDIAGNHEKEDGDNRDNHALVDARSGNDRPSFVV